MAPCRCLDRQAKEPYEMSMTCEPDGGPTSSLVRLHIYVMSHRCDEYPSVLSRFCHDCITEISLNVINPLHSNAKLTTNTTMDIHGTSWHQVPRKESASPKVSTSVEWIYPNTNVHIHITKHVFVLSVCLFACLLSTLTFSMTLKCKKKRLHFRHRCHFQWHSIAQWDSY